MVKKIILIFIFSSLLLSCGIKGDPKYEENNSKVITNEN